LFKKEKTIKNLLEKISYFFVLTCLANIIWIFLWHYEQILLSLIVMILLFFSLLIIYLRLNIGIEKVSMKEKLLVHVPISVYIGWITVATITNVTALLVTSGWNGFGISEPLWTILILVIVTIISILMLLKRKDIAYSLVVIWALIGIALKRFGSDSIYGIQTDVAITSIIAIIIILIMILYISFKEKIIKIKKS